MLYDIGELKKGKKRAKMAKKLGQKNSGKTRFFENECVWGWL